MAIYGINYINETYIDNIHQQLPKIAQEIFDILDSNIDYDYDQIIFRDNISDGSYSIKFWLKSGNKTYDCFKTIDKSKCMNIFLQCDKVVRPFWKSLKDKDKFSRLTIVFNKSGSFNTQIEYSDNVMSSDEWEDKYLQ